MAISMTTRCHSDRRRIDFRRVADSARDHAETIVRQWLPDGKRTGNEWTARNPTRSDRRPGSFRVSVRSCAWADFATGDRGGDLISLAAYLFNLSMSEAAERVAQMLAVDPYER